MVSIGVLYAYFVLAFFSGCPTWGDGKRMSRSLKNRRRLYLFTIPRKWNRTRMVGGNAVGLFSAGRIFYNHSLKTLVETPHIIIASGSLRSRKGW